MMEEVNSELFIKFGTLSNIKILYVIIFSYLNIYVSGIKVCLSLFLDISNIDISQKMYMYNMPEKYLEIITFRLLAIAINEIMLFMKINK
jgi:hypothetical protein